MVDNYFEWFKSNQPPPTTKAQLSKVDLIEKGNEWFYDLNVIYRILFFWVFISENQSGKHYRMNNNPIFTRHTMFDNLQINYKYI